jgi:hypothetical protein
MDYLKPKINNPEKAANILFVFIAFGLILACLLGDSLGEGGDSTTHYLYAKLSWENPSYFFYHWAKPLFTLLSSPFAQFGMKGMMLFNVFCSIAAAYLAKCTAKVLQFNYYYITGILVLSMPLILPVTLSGLTEPLSALLVILAVYCYLTNKIFWAIFLASILPFVRSEGLIIAGVFGALLLFEKRWKYLPVLAAGHLVFALLGWSYHHDFWWVFNKIPYATLSSVYGNGNWTHFVNQIYFCVQPFTFAMMLISLVYLPIEWVQKGWKMHWPKLFLIYGIVLAFVAAHSAFWALGIFNSMGLNRVLVTIFPLCAVMAMQSIHAITTKLQVSSTYTQRFMLFFMGGILIFPTLNNPAATKFKEAIYINKQHQFLRDALMPYLEQKHPNKSYFFSETEIGLFTGKDIFEQKLWLYPGAKVPPQNMQIGDVFIFDSLLMAAERNISVTAIRQVTNLKEDTVFAFTNNQNNFTQYHLFVKQ